MLRKSATRLAVLGVLAVEPASGYAIRRSISDTIAHFWSESFGQIYPTLAGLESEGLIDVVAVDARSKTFAITQAGRYELAELLESELRVSPPRDETLLRLFFGRFIGPGACQELLRDTEVEIHRQLSILAGIRTTLEAAHADSRDLPYWLLTVRSGELSARARLAWIREASTELSGLAEGQP